jgi:hypothetical protein
MLQKPSSWTSSRFHHGLFTDWSDLGRHRLGALGTSSAVPELPKPVSGSLKGLYGNRYWGSQYVCQTESGWMATWTWQTDEEEDWEISTSSTSSKIHSNQLIPSTGFNASKPNCSTCITLMPRRTMTKHGMHGWILLQARHTHVLICSMYSGQRGLSCLLHRLDAVKIITVRALQRRVEVLHANRLVTRHY